MQHHLVAFIAEGAQQAALVLVGIAQQSQRLVAMAGENDLIENALLPVGLAQEGAGLSAADGLDRLSQPDAARQAGRRPTSWRTGLLLRTRRPGTRKGGTG